MNTKQLRQKILDLAIRGKLVPQDPNDEPASILLKRIRAEKERLIKEGKIKRDKKDSFNIKDDDKRHYGKLPFDVPHGWAWVFVDDVGDTVTGSTPSKGDNKNYGNEYPFFKPTDLDMGIYVVTSFDMLSEKGYALSRKIPADSVLITCIGATIGKTGVIRVTGSCNQQINAVIPNEAALPEYVYYCITSDFFQEQMKRNAAATTLPIINKSRFLTLLFPLPPRSEQLRIVAAIESAFAVIDEIERNKADLLSTLAAAKSKILSLAIRGKLVPQDPDDEPASVLLERIRMEREKMAQAGKIKPSKRDSAIFKAADKSYYEKLPDGWELVDLGFFTNIEMGQSPKGESVSADSSGLEFHQGKIYFSDKYLSHSGQYASEITKIADENAVILCVRAPVGVANITKRKICIGRGLCALHPLSGVDEEFIYHWLSAMRSIFEEQATGTTFKAVTMDVVKGSVLPIPPLAEQGRIVATIGFAFATIDEIEHAVI